MKTKITILFLLILCACTKVNNEMQELNENYIDNLFIIKRTSVFYDGLAYAGKRGIYLISDKKSGKEYIGISGIGISETGSNPSGKIMIKDEQ